MRPGPKPHPIEERLWDVLIVQPNGCIEWPKGTDDFGYGRLWVDGKSWLTHRLAWTLVNGAIPKGISVLHHCDNPPCCQTEPTEGFPEGHLFLGTRAENNIDRDSKGRNGQSSKTHCPDGHEYTKENTYVWHGSRSCRKCNNGFSSRYFHKNQTSTNGANSV